jgi:hypothetical protein
VYGITRVHLSINWPLLAKLLAGFAAWRLSRLTLMRKTPSV